MLRLQNIENSWNDAVNEFEDLGWRESVKLHRKATAMSQLTREIRDSEVSKLIFSLRDVMDTTLQHSVVLLSLLEAIYRTWDLVLTGPDGHTTAAPVHWTFFLNNNDNDENNENNNNENNNDNNENNNNATAEFPGTALPPFRECVAVVLEYASVQLRRGKRAVYVPPEVRMCVQTLLNYSDSGNAVETPLPPQRLVQPEDFHNVVVVGLRDAFLAISKTVPLILITWLRIVDVSNAEETKIRKMRNYDRGRAGMRALQAVQRMQLFAEDCSERLEEAVQRTRDIPFPYTQTHFKHDLVQAFYIAETVFSMQIQKQAEAFFMHGHSRLGKQSNAHNLPLEMGDAIVAQLRNSLYMSMGPLYILNQHWIVRPTE